MLLVFDVMLSSCCYYYNRTLAAGLGPAPSDGVSLLVILVIAIGLGIPLLLMIGSSVFVCYRNHKKKREGYLTINE